MIRDQLLLAEEQQIAHAGLALKALQDEIAEIEKAERIRRLLIEQMALQLALANDLLPTRAEMNDKIAEEINRLNTLRDTLANLEAGTFTIIDAFNLLALGFAELAAQIQLMLAGLVDPAILGTSGAARGGTTYIQQVVIQGDPQTALAALGVQV